MYSPRISSLFYRFYVGSECGLRSNCSCKTGLPCLYDLSYERAGSPDFIDFSKIFKERKWSLIVVAVSTPPFFFFENCKKKVLIVVAVSTAPFSFVKNG
jgi:hypothetical protein|tara:strand:+ start:100 stop:396 length:297 start_codon:yes stop_codon:yes gene_type:complete